MIHTPLTILYTVECALLFVTWMTLPLYVTATRRFPSGDHATSYTLMRRQIKKKEAHPGTYNSITLRSIHFCLRGNIGDAECLVITASCHQSAVGGNRTPPHLQTQSESDQQHIAMGERRRTSYVIRVRSDSRLLDQLMRHCVHHSSRFPFLQPQLPVLTHSQPSLIRLRAQQRHQGDQAASGKLCQVGHVVV